LSTRQVAGLFLAVAVIVAMMKPLTQVNGGSVRVESVPGKGSTFFVVLTSDEGDRGMIHHAIVNK
jgi:light-regulated signal transduction histidine kinase (bacteriophytochrome)